MTIFTDKLAQICLAEYARWDNGAGRETQGTDDPGIAKDYYLFVEEYWKSININNLTGRTVQGGIRPAWSSAFVSFCIRKAGAGTKFKYSQAHCHYIDAAMKASAGANAGYGYRAMKPAAYTPKVGDIICGGREYAKTYDYDQAKMIYQADSFYPSHGDIVIEVTTTHAITIGGNIIHNVDRKKLSLDGNGRLLPRKDGSKSYPWIAVLACEI
ncbi:DUF2272 domain-containing protein [Sphingopyxis sp. OPL5]|uniref:DUF2272 domain-containing protein n=1 Tax=Sphingopyxis sp. OPL5 TaxID=2486273 RepID=UPI00164E2751|nr:DUF2272 domain-containing protein [Sphingopyxis sp. OPL5]QNO26086.1 DUF2272 domain-containing protein [Sphingopyxis sp. OPL5]